MSDARRRRKSHSGDSDDSDSYEEDLNNTKETQSSEQTDGHQDSECDGYGSDSDVESQEGALRESGDGQEEEKPQKKLDDDEDRRNPQYIPKKGTFYEHDDRTTDEVTDNTKEPSSERETKEKKVWKDKEDRWDHDRYNDEEQAPKSHEELIAVYGYDIRNEEGPPRARRRRKYGRGPNKYTRNWEDGDAYGKTGGNVSSNRTNNRKFSRSGEDFPALGTNKNTTAQVEEPVISSAWYSSKNKSQNKGHNFPPLQAQQQDGSKAKSASTFNTQVNENKAPNEPTNPAWKKDIKHGSNNHSANGNTGAGGDAEKLVSTKVSPRDNNKKNTQESVSLAASRARGRGFKANANNNIVANRTVESKPKGRGAGPIAAENRRNNVSQHEDEHQLVHDMKHMNVNDGMQYHQSGRHNKNFYQQSPAQQRPNTVPPRMQQQPHQQQQQTHQQQQNIQQQPQPQQQQQDASGNRPKRYSSLRQRPTIPDTPAQQNYPPQHAGQHGYFPPQAGNSRGVLDSQGFPQGHFEQSPPVAAPAAPMAGQPVISLPPSGQPASFAPPAFLVPPPQFIPPQTAPPSIINYVPGPNGPTFPPNFTGYQGYNPSVQPQGPPPPQELFQPQGCTYYSPAQQQQQQQQTAPMRRPKAAIPILPPPDNQQYQSGRGRGRSTQQNYQNSQPGNIQQVENENKGNIVDVVDSKVESGHCESRSEEQIEHIEQSENEQEPCVMVDTVENEEKTSTFVTDNTISDITATSTAASSTVAAIPITDTTDHTVIETPLDEHEVIEMSSEMILDQSKTTPLEPIEMTISKTDTESNKRENAISEKSIVEEAAA